MIWIKGQRTIVLSILAGLVAVLLQADYQGIFDMSPLIKLVLQLGLTVLLPMIPIYLRKGIDDAFKSNK